MLRQPCPNCGLRFSWRGPAVHYPVLRPAAPWYKPVAPTIRCRSCGVPLLLQTTARAWVALVIWLLAFLAVRLAGKYWLPQVLPAALAANIHAFSPAFFMAVGVILVERIGRRYVQAPADEPPP